SAFADLHLMEERGWGLKKMHDLTVQAGLPAPQFDYEDGAFVVTFYRVKSPPVRSQEENLPEMLRSILKLARSRKGRITSSVVARALRTKERTVRYHLRKLENLGFLQKQGSIRSVF